jgi:hypothetical protein
MSGKVIVTNDSGRVLHGIGCGTAFQLGLGNDKIPPAVLWPRCGQQLTIPIGESSWPVTVIARYSGCGQKSGDATFPRCREDGFPPSLPVGDYRAMLFQEPRFVPTPPSISIRVTP